MGDNFGGGDYTAPGGMKQDFSDSIASAKDIDLGGFKIINVANPVNVADAANKNYVDLQIAAIPGAMATNFSNAIASANDIDLGTHKLINVVDPTNAQDAATKNYVDIQISGVSGGANVTLSNLTSPTSINQDLLPDVNDTKAFGSLSKTWRKVYTNDFHLAIAGSEVFSITGSGVVTLENKVATGPIRLRTLGNPPASGSLLLSSGDANTGTSGNIELSIGNAPTKGAIKFTGQALPVVGHIWTATNVDGSGDWASGDITKNGVTAARPPSPVLGQRFFDTTINSPIWWSGANWVNGIGNIV